MPYAVQERWTAGCADAIDGCVIEATDDKAAGLESTGTTSVRIRGVPQEVQKEAVKSKTEPHFKHD